jgi:hypothetical protein
LSLFIIEIGELEPRSKELLIPRSISMNLL